MNAVAIAATRMKERSLVNDKRTLAEWFQAEHIGLYRLALVLSGQPAIAEDLVQDTFVRLSLAGAKPERDGISTYARKTLVNLHNSRLRRWYRERRAIERLSGRREETMPAPAEPADPALFAALKNLPRMQRAVVALRYLEDRSIEDVAEILGVSKGTVKAHAHRGLTAMRERLAEPNEGR